MAFWMAAKNKYRVMGKPKTTMAAAGAKPKVGDPSSPSNSKSEPANHQDGVVVRYMRMCAVQDCEKRVPKEQRQYYHRHMYAPVDAMAINMEVPSKMGEGKSMG